MDSSDAKLDVFSCGLFLAPGRAQHPSQRLTHPAGRLQFNEMRAFAPQSVLFPWTIYVSK